MEKRLKPPRSPSTLHRSVVRCVRCNSRRPPLNPRCQRAWVAQLVGLAFTPGGDDPGMTAHVKPRKKLAATARRGRSRRPPGHPRGRRDGAKGGVASHPECRSGDRRLERAVAKIVCHCDPVRSGDRAFVDSVSEDNLRAQGTDERAARDARRPCKPGRRHGAEGCIKTLAS